MMPVSKRWMPYGKKRRGRSGKLPNPRATVRVGLLEGIGACQGTFHAPVRVGETVVPAAPFIVYGNADGVTFSLGDWTAHGKEVTCQAVTPEGVFSLAGVTIGRDFHWQQEETESFRGDVTFKGDGQGRVTVINRLPVEYYLESVVSSEMSENAPIELLKAHAIIARSWLAARLAGTSSPYAGEMIVKEGEIIRWYGHESHREFDVCGDDHCQRYHGVTRLQKGFGARAVRHTRGMVLNYGDHLCDTRYHKACGGRTEPFAHVWEEREIPYLRSVSCAIAPFPLVESEEEAGRWMRHKPPAFCGATTPVLRELILPAIDRETDHFSDGRSHMEEKNCQPSSRKNQGSTLAPLPP